MNRYFFSVIVPFTYFFNTRVKSVPVLGYNVLNELLPNFFIGIVCTNFSVIKLLTLLVSAYLAFISVYEIGYYFNDAYSIKLEGPLARKRMKFEFSKFELAIWVLVRVIVLAIVTIYIVESSILLNWIFFYVSLIISFILHNYNKEQFRSATFICLAFLRFCSSGFLFISSHSLFQIFPGVVLYYIIPRLWAYQESKGMILMPHRKTNTFKMKYLASVTIIPLYISLNSNDATPLYLSLYYCGLYFIIFFIGRFLRYNI